MSTNFIILASGFGGLLVIGLEPIFSLKNQILSLTCLPISTKRATEQMAQFDFIIIGSMLFILIVTVTMYYAIALLVVLPNFFGVKKFRNKKFNLLSSEVVNPAYFKSFLY